jgi:hypothetical protein
VKDEPRITELQWAFLGRAYAAATNWRASSMALAA